MKPKVWVHRGLLPGCLPGCYVYGFAREHRGGRWSGPRGGNPNVPLLLHTGAYGVATRPLPVASFAEGPHVADLSFRCANYLTARYSYHSDVFGTTSTKHKRCPLLHPTSLVLPHFSGMLWTIHAQTASRHGRRLRRRQDATERKRRPTVQLAYAALPDPAGGQFRLLRSMKQGSCRKQASQRPGPEGGRKKVRV